jgi:hypothetical protein
MVFGAALPGTITKGIWELVPRPACFSSACHSWSNGKRFGMNVVGKAQGFSPIGIKGKNQKNYNGHFLKNKMLVPLSISFFLNACLLHLPYYTFEAYLQIH